MNTEYQLKSKLVWSVFPKGMKLKQKWYRSNTTAKNDVFIFLLGWIDVWWGGREWASFGWWEDSPIPLVGKTLYKLWFLYAMKKLRAHHIHHVPKWPSYFCKIWVLCVSQIYMAYIFTCVFSVCNTINLSHHEHV